MTLPQKYAKITKNEGGRGNEDLSYFLRRWL